jgi:hypothetical protein
MYSYEYMYVHLFFINIFKRLGRLNLKIYEVGHQERLTVNEHVIYH